MWKFIKSNLSTIVTLISAVVVLFMEHYFHKKIVNLQVATAILLLCVAYAIYFIENRCAITIEFRQPNIKEFDNMPKIKIALSKDQVSDLIIELKGEKIKKSSSHKKHIYIEFPSYIDVSPSNKRMSEYICNDLENSQVTIKIPLSEFENGRVLFRFGITANADSMKVEAFMDREVKVRTDFKLPINLKRNILLIDWSV